MIYVIYDAATRSIVAAPSSGAARGAGVRCLPPGSRQQWGLLSCHGDSCPSHSCNHCLLSPRGPPLPSESYFLSSGCAQDVLWPVRSSGAGDKCPNPQQRVGVSSGGWWPSSLLWSLSPE